LWAAKVFICMSPLTPQLGARSREKLRPGRRLGRLAQLGASCRPIKKRLWAAELYTAAQVMTAWSVSAIHAATDFADLSGGKPPLRHRHDVAVAINRVALSIISRAVVRHGAVYDGLRDGLRLGRHAPV